MADPAVGSYRAVMCEKISKTSREGIDSIVLNSLPRQATLSDDEVRIEVRSASVNFPEILMLQNKYQHKPPLPFVLCTEGAGIVREVGAGVRRFKVGDRVLFASMGGCAREEVVLPEAICHILPSPLSFSQGASFMMGYSTGYHGLVHRGNLKAGEWLLVTGAAGGMGIMAVELGKALGARVIAAASSDEKLAICKAAGADYVVNYSKQKLKDAVGEITKGSFCDVIYDVVGGEVFDQCVRCVAPMGQARLLVVGFTSGTIPKFPVNMALIKGFSVVGVRSGAQLAIQPELNETMITDLLKMAEDGKLKPHVGSEYPPERAKEALTAMDERQVLGKSCITFGASSKL
jgi:NADPH2:quinone reductase